MKNNNSIHIFKIILPWLRAYASDHNIIEVLPAKFLQNYKSIQTEIQTAVLAWASQLLSPLSSPEIFFQVPLTNL